MLFLDITDEFEKTYKLIDDYINIYENFRSVTLTNKEKEKSKRILKKIKDTFKKLENEYKFNHLPKGQLQQEGGQINQDYYERKKRHYERYKNGYKMEKPFNDERPIPKVIDLKKKSGFYISAALTLLGILLEEFGNEGRDFYQHQFFKNDPNDKDGQESKYGDENDNHLKEIKKLFTGTTNNKPNWFKTVADNNKDAGQFADPADFEKHLIDQIETKKQHIAQLLGQYREVMNQEASKRKGGQMPEQETSDTPKPSTEQETSDTPNISQQGGNKDYLFNELEISSQLVFLSMYLLDPYRNYNPIFNIHKPKKNKVKLINVSQKGGAPTTGETKGDEADKNDEPSENDIAAEKARAASASYDPRCPGKDCKNTAEQVALFNRMYEDFTETLKDSPVQGASSRFGQSVIESLNPFAIGIKALMHALNLSDGNIINVVEGGTTKVANKESKMIADIQNRAFTFLGQAGVIAEAFSSNDEAKQAFRDTAQSVAKTTYNSLIPLNSMIEHMGGLVKLSIKSALATIEEAALEGGAGIFKTMFKAGFATVPVLGNVSGLIFAVDDLMGTSSRLMNIISGKGKELAGPAEKIKEAVDAMNQVKQTADSFGNIFTGSPDSSKGGDTKKNKMLIRSEEQLTENIKKMKGGDIQDEALGIKNKKEFMKNLKKIDNRSDSGDILEAKENTKKQAEKWTNSALDIQNKVVALENKIKKNPNVQFLQKELKTTKDLLENLINEIKIDYYDLLKKTENQLEENFLKASFKQKSKIKGGNNILEYSNIMEKKLFEGGLTQTKRGVGKGVYDDRTVDVRYEDALKTIEETYEQSMKEISYLKDKIEKYQDDSNNFKIEIDKLEKNQLQEAKQRLETAKGQGREDIGDLIKVVDKLNKEIDKLRKKKKIKDKGLKDARTKYKDEESAANKIYKADKKALEESRKRKLEKTIKSSDKKEEKLKKQKEIPKSIKSILCLSRL